MQLLRYLLTLIFGFLPIYHHFSSTYSYALGVIDIIIFSPFKERDLIWLFTVVAVAIYVLDLSLQEVDADGLLVVPGEGALAVALDHAGLADAAVAHDHHLGAPREDRQKGLLTQGRQRAQHMNMRQKKIIIQRTLLLRLYCDRKNIFRMFQRRS